METAAIAKSLLKLGNGVRMVSICDMNGKLVYHARGSTVQNKLSAKESTASLKMAASQWAKRKKLAAKLGKCKYAMAEYEEVKRITMPAGRKYLLYVTTTKRFDHAKVIRKVSTFK